MKVNWLRRNPIFFERDGAFNPSWVIIAVLVVLQCYATVWAFQQDSAIVKTVSLSLLGVTVNIFVIAAVSQNKAKILASAKSSGEIAKGLVAAVRPFGGKADSADVDDTVPQ